MFGFHFPHELKCFFIKVKNVISIFLAKRISVKLSPLMNEKYFERITFHEIIKDFKRLY